MVALRPSSVAEAASLLSESAKAGRTIQISGLESKRGWGGPCAQAEVTLNTAGLNRIVQYERNDLTVSVEAGMPFQALQAELAREGQMIGLAPPFRRTATVGGIVATNLGSLWERRFGGVRDMVIGLSAVTLEGKLVRSGGMVVKNVAGLDMAKLLIGSFGTLALIGTVNFRVHPLPEVSRTFLLRAAELAGAIEQCRKVLHGPLRPLSIILLNPLASARVGQRNYLVAIRAGSTERVMQRFRTELPLPDILEGAAEAVFWDEIREFGPNFLGRQPQGLAVKLKLPLSDLPALLPDFSAPAIVQAGCGSMQICLTSTQQLTMLSALCAKHGWSFVVQAAPAEFRTSQPLWHAPSSTELSHAFDTMSRVKRLFDPHNQLNPGRLYGRF